MPSSGSLFEPINSLVYMTYMMWVLGVVHTLWLRHILLGEMPVEKCVININLEKALLAIECNAKHSMCKTRENSNFLKKGKIIISVKIQKFSRSWMMKQTSPLESSRKI